MSSMKPECLVSFQVITPLHITNSRRYWERSWGCSKAAYWIGPNPPRSEFCHHLEIALLAGPSCIILVGELECEFHQDPSDVLGQILCEADGTSIPTTYVLTTLGADYVNFKAKPGATPIFCLLVDKRERRFSSTGSETRPFTVQRIDRTHGPIPNIRPPTSPTAALAPWVPEHSPNHKSYLRDPQLNRR